jgi:hypothetical protein
MWSKGIGLFAILLSGVLILGGCPADDGGDDGGGAGTSVSEAYFPVVDALSSASILRTDFQTMVYVGERSGTSYSLNRIDINGPSSQISQKIGSNVAVIAADTGGSRIGIIQAVERGYEAFAGSYTKIYNAATLELLRTFPLAPPAAGGRIIEPLHHRDPSLSLTDKYAVVLTEDDGYFASGGAQQYVSVYDIAGNKGSYHANAFQGNSGAARGAVSAVFGVGTLMGAAVHGDYIILGGSAGTGVFQIDASGSALTLNKVENASDTTGNHWFKDNGVYVLEPKSNTGTVKIWKWNASGAPTAVGTVDVYEAAGSVQALCFDPDNPAKAYFFNKAAASAGYGAVYSVDLSDPALTKTTLFSFPRVVIQISGRGGSAYYQCEMSGTWTIEKQSDGADNYYVFSGGYSYGTGAAAAAIGGVLTVKNPPAGASVGGSYTDSATATLDARVTETRFSAPYNTAVRTLKTFKSASGDVYFAAKNYTASGAASNYQLLLEQIN